jgi:hypothetical protein
MPRGEAARRTRRLKAAIGPQKIESAERQQAAVEARSRGMSWDRVAEYAGYESITGAKTAVKKWLAQMRDATLDSVDELRSMEVARLDRALLEITFIAYDRNIPHDRRLMALEAIRRNVETRSKLRGLFAPEQHEVITIGMMEQRVAQLSHELGMPLPTELLEIAAGDDPADEPAF